MSNSVTALVRLRSDGTRQLDEQLTAVDNNFKNSPEIKNTTAQRNLISIDSYPNDSTESSSSDDNDSSTISRMPKNRKSIMCEILPDTNGNKKLLDEIISSDNTSSIFLSDNPCDKPIECVNNNYIHTTATTSCNYNCNIPIERKITESFANSPADIFEGGDSNEANGNCPVDIIDIYKGDSITPCLRSFDQITLVKPSKFDELNDSRDGEELSPGGIVFVESNIDDLNNEDNGIHTIISETDTAKGCNNISNFSVENDGLLDTLSLGDVQIENNFVDLKSLEYNYCDEQNSNKINDNCIVDIIDVFKDNHITPCLRSFDQEILVSPSKYNEPINVVDGKNISSNIVVSIHANVDNLKDKNDGKCTLLSDTDIVTSCNDFHGFPDVIGYLPENLSSIGGKYMENLVEIKPSEDNCFEKEHFNRINCNSSINFINMLKNEQNPSILRNFDEINNSKGGDELLLDTVISDNLNFNQLCDNDHECIKISKTVTSTSCTDFSVGVRSISEKLKNDDKCITHKHTSGSYSKSSGQMGSVRKASEYNDINNLGDVEESLSNVCVNLNNNNEEYNGIFPNIIQIADAVESRCVMEEPKEHGFDGPSKSNIEKFGDCISSNESFVSIDSGQSFLSYSIEPIIPPKIQKCKKKKCCIL